MRDLLMHLKGTGKTIFLNWHLLSEVELICDRVTMYEAKAGSVLSGTVDELTSVSDTFRFSRVFGN